MRAVVLAGVLACVGCAGPAVDVTVSEPKVYGDDQVLRALETQRRRLLAMVRGVRVGDYQESFGVGHEEHSQTRLGVNLAEPGSGSVLPSTPRPLPTRRQRWWGLGPFDLQPLLPGLSFQSQLRQRAGAAAALGAHERLLMGDARLLARRSRAALLRFDVSINSYADLGSRRRFAVVEFAVQGKQASCPKFGVYLLSPEYSAYVSRERSTNRALREFAGQLLGSWGGVGAGAGYGSSSLDREDFEALLETPLQFGVYDGAPVVGGGRRFAFALGPRRRLVERGTLNPAAWFGADYEIAYELQPGARRCEVLLVFEDVRPGVPVEVQVDVHCDGRLVAEEEVDLTPALGGGRRPLKTFAVRCPAAPGGGQTERAQVDPGATTDLLVASGPEGPSFSAESEVWVGPQAVPAGAVRVVGRGRLAVHVPPSRALARIRARGQREVAGRILTPGQPDLNFVVELTGGAE